MDKRAFYAIYFIMLIWMGWWIFVVMPQREAQKKQAAAQAEIEAMVEEANAKNASGDVGAPEEKAEAAVVEKVDDIMLGKDEPGEDPTYYVQAKLTNEGAAVRDMYLNRYDSEDREGRLHILSDETAGTYSYLLWLEKDKSLRFKNWDVVSADEANVVFRTTAQNGAIEVTKTFKLDEKSKMTQLELSFTNKTDAPLGNIEYHLTGGNGVPVEGVWYTRYFRSAEFVQRNPDIPSGSLQEVQARTIVDAFNNKQNQAAFTQIPVQFAGVTAQYFTSLVIQPFNFGESVENNQIREASPLYVSQDKSRPELSNIGIEMKSLPLKIEPGETVTHKYLLFNGPKKETVLAEFAEYRLPEIIHYPSFLFIPVGGVSVVLTAVLEFFHSIVGDYGLAIILLTVTVRLCLFPLNFWQHGTMAKMQSIQPLMEQIRKEAGDNFQEYGRRVRELQAKHKVNPYMGCLPAFIQLPILVGLWQALALDFNLRQAPFLFGYTWIDDLSAPDMLFKWPSWLGFLDGLLGPYFNLLPLVSLGLIITVMLLSGPPPSSADAKVMRRVMIGMMVFMSFMFYKVPSGLCIYIITGSIWGIAERKLLPKPKPSAELQLQTEQAKAALADPKRSEDTSWKKPVDQKKKPARR